MIFNRYYPIPFLLFIYLILFISPTTFAQSTENYQVEAESNDTAAHHFRIPILENSAVPLNWGLFGGDDSLLQNYTAPQNLKLDGSIDTRGPSSEIYSRIPWPDPRINFLPGGVNIPAGDLTGNGLSDMIRVYLSTDERDDNPETITYKTLVFKGGSELTEPDFILYDRLNPIGDINGSGQTNLISNSGFNKRAVYEFNGSEFVEIHTGDLEDHIFIELSAADFSADADGDGYGDRVRYSSNKLRVYFGTDDISGIELKEYDLFDFLDIYFEGSINNYHLKNVVSVNGESYFLFRFIVPMHSHTSREGGRYIAIFKMNQNRELERVQEFKISNNTFSVDGKMFTALLPGEEQLSLIYFNYTETTDSENLSGYESFRIRASDEPELLFKEEKEPFFPSTLWPAGDLKGDGYTDFIVLNEEDLFFYHGEYDENENELVVGEKLPFQEEIRQLHLAQSDFTVFGDHTGNGKDDYYLALASGVIIEGEPSFGQLRISGDGTRSYIYDTADYSLHDYQRTSVENIFMAGDITGNGVEDFIIYYSSTQNRDRELVLHQGGSNWKEPYKVWIIEEGRSLIDLTTGNFTSTDRRDIAIITRIINPTDGIREDKIELIEGGSSPADTPYFTLEPRGYVEGLSDQAYDHNFFQIIENAGDVNNSGFDDLLISTPQKIDSEGNSLPPGLYFGGEQLSANGADQLLYFEDDYLGAMDYRGNYLGTTLKGLGDISGNGIDDFAVADIEARFEDTWNFGNRALGAVHIYYGVDEKEPEFSRPDLTLRADSTELNNNANFFRFGLSEIATGDFNGDGNNDIAVKPQAHFNGSTNQGIPGVHLFHHSLTEGQPQQILPLHSNHMDLLYDQSEDLFLSYMPRMRMAGIPDITGNGHDELLMMATGGFTNAVIHLGDEVFSDKPDILLRLPNTGLSVSPANPSLQNQLRTPVGDITGDGLTNILMPQADPAFRDHPIYMFEISETFVSNDPISVTPNHFNLAQNYPNPFNPVTVIGYQLPVQSDVKLEVFDLLGRRVAVLVDGRQAAGTHQAEFDASNLASGVYLYRLQSDDFVQTRQMVLVK